ncbi:MAG: OmpA family protein [Verrucomicrobiota bacterium]
MKNTWIPILVVGLAAGWLTTGCNTSSKARTKLPNGGGNSQPPVTDNASRPPIEPLQPPIAVDPNTIKGNPLDPKANANSQDMPEPKGLDGMTADRDAFKADTVYFDFDRAAVRKNEHAHIEAVAKVLKDQPKSKLQIEGHCDEMGTDEYNRALGERRALAIREYLMTLGIEGKRLFTISYGKDRPAVEAHDEAARNKNRRGEFVLYKPKS